MLQQDPKQLADRVAKTLHIIRESPYVPIQPLPKQLLFLADDHKEILYGGAAGGGKSVALLAAALMYAHVPGYSALLLRRTLPDLKQPGGLIPMSKAWLNNTDAKWHDRETEWQFPGGGVLRFGYLETPDDMLRYQGGEYSFIGWDELTQMPEGPYLYLFSRLRQNITVDESGVPLRVRASANPGGKHGEWVRDRFIRGSHPDRLFIPATFKENSHIDTAAYENALSNLDPLTRAQLEDGDWDITAQGTLFSPQDVKMVSTRNPDGCRRVRVWDLAGGGEGSDWSVGLLVSINDGKLRVEDVFRERVAPARLEAAMQARARLDGRVVPILIEQEPGSAGKMAVRHLRNNVLKGHAVTPQRPTGHKADRARLASALCSQGRLEMLEGKWNRDMLNEMAQFYTEGANDDMVDCLSYAAHFLIGRRALKSGAKKEESSETELTQAPSKRIVVTPRPQDRWNVGVPSRFTRGR